MGTQFEALKQAHIDFIQQQKLFFVATATDTSRVNLSPKGMDSFRVLDNNRVQWLNVTGSGNETATHIQSHPRMTIMFCAFEGAPIILRLYGTARAIHKGEAQWDALYEQFPPTPGARQIFDVTVDLVQKSCGMSVPFFDYVEDREELSNWARGKDEEQLRAYWKKKNFTSIDGIDSGLAGVLGKS